MNAEAILEAVKAYAKNRIDELNGFPLTYERGIEEVAQDILTLIEGLERKKNENMR